jgi:hypothetical protein
VNCAAIPEQLLEAELFGYLQAHLLTHGKTRRGCSPWRIGARSFSMKLRAALIATEQITASH